MKNTTATKRRPPRLHLVLAIIVAALALGLAACGDDDDFDGIATADIAARGEAGDGGGDDAGGAVTTQSFASAAPVVPVSEAALTGGGGGGGFDPAQLAGRTIIRNGSIELEVEDVEIAFEQVRLVAERAGGFVTDSSFFGRARRENDLGEVIVEQSARLTIRIPVEGFGSVIADLRDLAIEVRSISTGANDVTGQVTDLRATLNNLRAVEAQFVTLLGEAGTIAEIVLVQDRVNQTRLQIDRTVAQLSMLENLADLATISVTLRPEAIEETVAAEGSGPLYEAGKAWDASLDTIEAIATVALVIAVFSWWLVPVILVAFLVLRRTALFRLRRGG